MPERAGRIIEPPRHCSCSRHFETTYRSFDPPIIFESRRYNELDRQLMAKNLQSSKLARSDVLRAPTEAIGNST